jgi:hypothetical protein
LAEVKLTRPGIQTLLGEEDLVRSDVYSRRVATVSLSDHVRITVEKEREVVEARLAALQEQSLRLHALVDAVDADARETARLLRNIDEMLGLAPQLSLEALHGELRGRKLQEIAVELLRQKRVPGDEIHYKDWFGLLIDAGLQVAGRDPLATFLTQVSKAAGVESVRPRSGLYRLRTAQ